MPKLGVYKHFKGKEYQVLGIIKHSETLEDLVLYKPLYKSELSDLWVRPIKIFSEEVEKNGYKGPRFVWVREEI